MSLLSFYLLVFKFVSQDTAWYGFPFYGKIMKGQTPGILYRVKVWEDKPLALVLLYSVKVEKDKPRPPAAPL